MVSDLSNVGGLDPLEIVNTGATELTVTIPSGSLNTVLLAYYNALTSPYTIAMVMVSIAIVPALSMEWRNVKAKPKSADGA